MKIFINLRLNAAVYRIEKHRKPRRSVYGFRGALTALLVMLLVAAAYSLETINISPRAADRLSGMFVHRGTMNDASVEAGVEVNQRAEVSGLYVKLFTGQETIEAVYFLDFPSRRIELEFPGRKISTVYDYPLTGPQLNYYRAIDTMDRVIEQILAEEGITYNPKIRLFNDERSKPAYSLMFPPDNKRFVLFKQNPPVCL